MRLLTYLWASRDDHMYAGAGCHGPALEKNGPG